MAYAQAKVFDPADIPVVDITALRDGSNPQSVADALHTASKDLGFIYIKGHGIPESVISNARSTALDFFHSANTLKSRVSISGEHRGWLDQGAAKMQDKAKTDLKESFICGYENNLDCSDDHPLRGVNQWPEFVPNLKQTAMDYFEQSHKLAFYLMQGFALGLGLDKQFFLQSSNQPLSRASFVYYPNQPEELGVDQFGVGPHTDFGVLTLLCQDDVGGLQVQNIQGDWIHAPPIADTLLVNVGDLLSRWTDGVYKSTPHRVVNNSGKERLSLVLAFDPNPETQIDASDVFGKEYSAQEEAISCGDYLIWRFGKAFSYRSKKHD